MKLIFALVTICQAVSCITGAFNIDPYLEDKLEEAALLQQALAEEEPVEYSDNLLDNLIRMQEKRACVKRNGNCDHRPNDCCFSSSCRCNLWGSNCRCQRVGLFQKWG